MLLLDADVLIAFFRESDQSHKRAVELIDAIDEQVIITTVILSEVLTFIKSRDGGKSAKTVWEKIRGADIEIIEITDNIDPIVSIMEKYDGLSFGDSSNIAMMQKSGLQKIISFDSDFDNFPGIERLH